MLSFAGEDETKRKAITQLASELKKKKPSHERLIDLVPEAIRAKVDINESLPIVWKDGAMGDVDDNLEEKEAQEEANCALNSTTDEEGVTDNQNSADDSSEGESEREIPNALPLNPLQQAAYNGHRPSIKVLLSHNVDIDRKVEAPGYEFSNLSAVEIAEQRGHHKSARLIHDYAVFRNHSSSSDAETEDEMLTKSGYNSCDLSVGDDKSLLPLSPASSRSASPLPYSPLASATSVPNDPNGPRRLRSLSEDVSLDADSAVGVGTADGYKRPTEDRVVIANMHEKVDLYCVFDGHGGRHYADFVAKQLPPRIRKGVNDLAEKAQAREAGSSPSPEEYAQMLEECFLEIDNKLVQHSERMSLLKVGGTTAVVALITPTHIISANVGDSPCVLFDATTGNLLRETIDHTPSNADEAKRVTSKGGNMIIGEDSGDLRLLSSRGHIGITRAFGQVDFKRGINEEDYVVCGAPQTYIWARDTLQGEMQTRFEEKVSRKSSQLTSEVDVTVRSSFEQQRLEHKIPDRPRLFLAMYSDSFTEALCDHPRGELDAATKRPKQIITNCLSNETVLVLFSDVLRSNEFNCGVSAEYLAQKQQNKFQFEGKFYGDNTSLILVDLENLSHPPTP